MICLHTKFRMPSLQWFTIYRHKNRESCNRHVVLHSTEENLNKRLLHFCTLN